jgi:O-antigen ligase
VFVPGLLESFEVPKIALIRVLGLGALAGWIVGAWPGRRSAFEWAVLAWVGVEAAATAMSVSPRLSLVGDALQDEGLLTSLALAGLALAGRSSLAGERGLARAVEVTLLAVSVACAYALVQVAGFDPLPWVRTASYGEGFARPFGTLGHPNLLGVLAAAATVWAVAILMRGGRRWLYGPAAVLTGLATLLTFSRAAWLGLGAGVGVALVLTACERGPRRMPWRGLAAALVIAVAVAALFSWGGWGRLFSARAAELGRGGAGTGASRVEIWASAVSMWRDRPLLGQGPDTFELMFPAFQTEGYWRAEWAALPFHAHSVYLHTLATRGLAGAAAVTALLLAGSVAAWRAWRRPAQRGRVILLAGGSAAIAVCGLAGAIGINGALGLLFAGAALDAAEASAAPAGSASAGARRRTITLMVSVAVGLIAALWVSRDLEVARALGGAARAAGRDPALALALAERAVRVAPAEDRAWAALAEARTALALQRRDPVLAARAVDAAGQAVAAGPRRAQHHQRLGAAHGAQALLGDRAAIPAMERSYARAESLAPRNALLPLERARWWIVLDRPEAALEPARRAAALYPDEALPLATLAAALVAVGERDSARAALERALAGRWRAGEADRAAAVELHSRLGRTPGPSGQAPAAALGR